MSPLFVPFQLWEDTSRCKSQLLLFHAVWLWAICFTCWADTLCDVWRSHLSLPQRGYDTGHMRHTKHLVLHWALLKDRCVSLIGLWAYSQGLVIEEWLMEDSDHGWQKWRRHWFSWPEVPPPRSHPRIVKSLCGPHPTWAIYVGKCLVLCFPGMQIQFQLWRHFINCVLQEQWSGHRWFSSHLLTPAVWNL